MRLAISNIAWPSDMDEAIVPILHEYGAEGVEIAPTKIWPRPLEATGAEVRSYREFWERRGLRIVALQSLLFGRPDLTLFDGPSARGQAVDFLKGMISLAAGLGAEALVFGSPKNRRVGSLPPDSALAIAVPLFRELGDFASRLGVSFCIEPNPTDYGCDFITSAPEGLDLVQQVGSPGFGLHLDTGGMTLAGDPPDATFARSQDHWRHFHISEPNLAPIGLARVDHRAIADAARRVGYGHWTSIEMREPAPEQSCVEAVRSALGIVRDVYGSAVPVDRV